MKLKILLATVIIMITALNSADAQSRQHSINQRHRVREGVRNGELTRHETRALALRKRDTRRDIRRAHRDGVVTRRERREIRMDRRHNSRAIYRKKHNRRHRAI